MALEIAVGIFDLPTSGTTVDFTISGFGTPKLAEFYAVNNLTLGTIENHHVISYGATDGTNQWTLGGQSENNRGSSDCDRFSDSTRCLIAVHGGTAIFNGELSINSFITDGVRCDVDNSFNNAFKCIVVLTRGSDVDATVGNLTVAASVGGTVSVTGLPSTPDYVKFATIGVQTLEFADIRYMTGRGMCVNDGSETQRLHIMRERNALSVMECAGTFKDNRCIGAYVIGSNALDWTAELTSFDASGFTLTTRDSAAPSGTDAFYVAVACPSNSVYLGTYVCPTGTGNDAVTGVGFQPKYLEFQMTRHDQLNELNNSNEAGVIGTALIDENTQGAMCCSCDDAASTSITKSVLDNQAVYTLAHSGVVAQEATFVSFDSDGWTLNWSDISIATHFYAFAIEDESAGGNTGTLDETLAALTLAGEGDLDIEGTASETLAALTSDGIAELDIAGTLAKTLGALTLSGLGSGADTSGTADITLGDLTADGLGELDIDGTADATLEALVLTGVGDLLIEGLTAETLDALTADGIGELAIIGSTAATLEAVALAGSGFGSGIEGTLNQTLEPVTLFARETAGGDTLDSILHVQHLKTALR